MEKIKFRKLGGHYKGFYCLKLGDYPTKDVVLPEVVYKCGEIVEADVKQNAINPSCADLTFEDGTQAIEVDKEYFLLPIPISLPAGAEISSNLYEEMQPYELNQDIVVVNIGNKTICVDWFPENDPKGQFYVRMFKDGKEIGCETATTPKEAAEWAEKLANQTIL